MDIWLLLLAAAVVGIAGSICAQFAQNIRAKRIEIVDRNGKGLIQLSVERPGRFCRPEMAVIPLVPSALKSTNAYSANE